MKLFYNYSRDYEMALQVMGAMAEEIVQLRQKNDKLAAANVDLQQENEDFIELFEEQNKTIACLHDKIRRAADILTK